IAPAVDADALVGPHYRHRSRLLDDRGAIDAVTVEQLVAEIDRHLRAATLEHHPAARGGPRLRLRRLGELRQRRLLASGDAGDHEVDDLDGAVRHVEAEARLMQVMEALPQFR